MVFGYNSLQMITLVMNNYWVSKKINIPSMAHLRVVGGSNPPKTVEIELK